MKQIVFAVLTVLLTSTMVVAKAPAVDKKDLAKCAAMTADLNRLTCFDALTQKLSVDKPKKTTSNVGKWEVSNSISPVDDSKTVVLRLEAESEIRGWLSVYKPVLIIRCSQNKTAAYIITGMQARGEYPSENVSVTLRFDRQRAKVIKMSKSTDSKALFFGNEVRSIKQMAKHQKMLFQFTPFNSSPTMTTFQLGGLSKAMKPLRKVCGW